MNFLTRLTVAFTMSVFLPLFGSSDVHEHGYWSGEDVIYEHRFDNNLAQALVGFFKNENAKTIVDFGCGMGDYVKTLQENQFYCEGYDGNPDTFKLSGGVAHVIDLSEPFDLNKRFDWVLSLEVGEHLPKQYEQTFIENIEKHCIDGIVLSWAIKGQGGHGHFNEQNNDYVKEIMQKYGYVNDVVAEDQLREDSSLWWFKNTIMVFRKQQN